MRWPNRHPHVLTPGMRRAQAALSRFLPLIDWVRFRRRNLNSEIVTSHRDLAVFGCGDQDQALVWLLRKAPLSPEGRLDRTAAPIRAMVRIPGLASGTFRITPFDTEAGQALPGIDAQSRRGALVIEAPQLRSHLALAVVRKPQ